MQTSVINFNGDFNTRSYY